MFCKKNFMIVFALVTSIHLTVFSAATDNSGFYANLSDNEKMHLIIAALDEGLFQIFTNFQNDQNVDELSAALSAGLEKNKAIFSSLNVSMNPNIMYLTFLENAYFLCKFGKTAQLLAVLNETDRTALFNLCYNCWLTDYTTQLNLNLSYMLDDLNEHFATP